MNICILLDSEYLCRARSAFTITIANLHGAIHGNEITVVESRRHSAPSSPSNTVDGPSAEER